MESKSTHLKEIAYELGLSINTVSRALRDCNDISEATKSKVRTKAIEMGYIPNSVSQFINQGNTKLVGLLVNNMKNLYFSIITDLFVSELKKGRIDFTLIYADEHQVSTKTIKRCISQRVDAIISFYEPAEEATTLANLYKMPLVFNGTSEQKELFCVHTNNYQGGKLAANYLSTAHKNKKFLYIGIKDYADSKERFRGFKDGLMANCPDYELLYIDIEKDDDYNILEEIYKGYLSIFCFNDDTAYSLLRHLNKLIPNIRKIYQSLHIVGFDCLSEHLNSALDLSSINFDYTRIVKDSINYIKDAWNNKEPEDKSVCIPTYLHTRLITS